MATANYTSTKCDLIMCETWQVDGGQVVSQCPHTLVLNATIHPTLVNRTTLGNITASVGHFTSFFQKGIYDHELQEGGWQKMVEGYEESSIASQTPGFFVTLRDGDGRISAKPLWDGVGNAVGSDLGLLGSVSGLLGGNFIPHVAFAVGIFLLIRHLWTKSSESEEAGNGGGGGGGGNAGANTNTNTNNININLGASDDSLSVS